MRCLCAIWGCDCGIVFVTPPPPQARKKRNEAKLDSRRYRLIDQSIDCFVGGGKRARSRIYVYKWKLAKSSKTENGRISAILRPRYRDDDGRFGCLSERESVPSVARLAPSHFPIQALPWVAWSTDRLTNPLPPPTPSVVRSRLSDRHRRLDTQARAAPTRQPAQDKQDNMGRRGTWMHAHRTLLGDVWTRRSSGR